MRPVILVLCYIFMLVQPVAAEDTFAYFERGTWRGPTGSQSSCESNPLKIQFSQSKTRAIFSHPSPVIDYSGKLAKDFGYTVISHDQDGIIMALDNETRKTPLGKPVVWVLKRLPNNMFCWGQTDWPSTGCLYIHVRCPTDPPIS